MNWTYAAIMLAAVATGIVLFRRTQEPLGLNGWEKFGLGLGAFCGGMIGAKLPFVLADWQGLVSGTAWLDDGKTIMAGLVGGYLGVQLAEWAMGIRARMCDGFAVPLAGAVAVGRLACFSAGCCYGTVTSLPWGIDFGDGQPRHPTQLYESAFHLAAAVILYRLQRRGLLRGRLIRVYFVAYFSYRFLTEFIRPEPALWLGLTGYQWAALFLASVFTLWSCPRCRPQTVILTRKPPFWLLQLRSWLDPARLAGNGRPRAAGNGAPVPLAETQTLCPACLASVPGTIFEQAGKVYLRRTCAEHGTIVALLSSDRRHYYLRDEAPHPPPTGQKCCRPAPGHRTCVALLELTEACNLGCPVCFAASPRAGHRRFEDLSADLEAFLAARGPLDVLQLSGGEPLLHPDVLRILDLAKTLPIDQVMINTNGLELVRNEGLATELARRRHRLEIAIQMDGLDPQSHRALRGRDLLAEKHLALEKLVEHDLRTTLVATVVRGVNEAQLGDLVRLGLGIRQVRGVTFQPATFSGRFALGRDPLDRLTLADVVRLVAAQSGGLLEACDFKPLPCSNPNCCGIAFLVRPPGRPALPLARLIDYEKHLDRLADRVNFNLADAAECLGRGWRPDDFFRVAVKPFMDACTYDQQRIDECCIHVIRPGGKAVSFCRFNALERGQAAGPDLPFVECAHGARRE